MRFRHVAWALALLLATASGTVPARAEHLPQSDRVNPTEFRGDRDLRGTSDRSGWLRLLSRIHVTPVQRARITSILRTSRDEMRPLREDMRQVRRQLRRETERGYFDERRIRSLARRQARTQTEMTVARARLTARIMAVLSPPQREQLRDLRDRSDDRWDRRGEYGRYERNDAGDDDMPFRDDWNAPSNEDDPWDQG